MPSVRQMEYFVEVAEAGSLRQAASRLGVTQPTLTAQLRTLEENLGVVLLERTRSATTLSPAGRELLPSIRDLLHQWRDLVESARLLGDDATSTYRLGVPPTLGPYLLPTLLPALHKEFGRLRLHVREEVPGNLQDGLINGDFDLVIGPFMGASEKIVSVPLFREPLLLAAAADTELDLNKDLTENDLSGLEVLGLDERHTLRREVERICDRTGARLNRNYEGTSLDTLRQMVVMGMGIAFLPALYVRSEVHRPEEILIRPLQGGRLFREHSLMYRSSAPSRHFFKEMTDFVRGVIDRELRDSVIPL